MSRLPPKRSGRVAPKVAREKWAGHHVRGNRAVRPVPRRGGDRPAHLCPRPTSARPSGWTAWPSSRRPSQFVTSSRRRDGPSGTPILFRGVGEREALDRRAPIFREQVAISLPHRLGLVAHPLVDDPLVDAQRGEVGRERVPVGVEADLEPALLAAQAPGRPPQRLPEGPRRRLHARAGCPSPRSQTTYWPPGPLVAPRQQDRLQLGVEVDPPRRLDRCRDCFRLRATIESWSNSTSDQRRRSTSPRRMPV